MIRITVQCAAASELWILRYLQRLRPLKVFEQNADIGSLMSESDPCNALREAKIRIEEDGGFVIPAAFRSALGIKAGDELILRWEDDELRITKKLPGERARRRAR